MMERSFETFITTDMEAEFRSSIEGCIPDLMMAGGESMNEMLDYEDRDPDESDWDSIYDYSADRACDTFPNVSQELRTALATRAANYYCGPQESDTDEVFKVVGLYQVAEILGEG